MDTIWRPDLMQDGGPKYLALARALREAIRVGELPEGAQLPTVRDLAWRLSVTPGTVSRAYQIATQEGLLQATVGRGTFVAARTPQLGPKVPIFIERNVRTIVGRIDLRSPSLPDMGQAQAIAEALRRVSLQNATDWLDYPSQAQELPLREAVCDWLDERVLGAIGSQDIMLTHGGQNGIGLILDCCLRGDKPVVLTEDLSYPGFRYAARASRAEVIGVELDAEGVVPDALEAACRRHGPQVLCLTPAAQNPTTAQMSEVRKAAIVSIARRYNLQVVEDECYPSAASDAPTLRGPAAVLGVAVRAGFVGADLEAVDHDVLTGDRDCCRVSVADHRGVTVAVCTDKNGCIGGAAPTSPEWTLECAATFEQHGLTRSQLRAVCLANAAPSTRWAGSSVAVVSAVALHVIDCS